MKGFAGGPAGLDAGVLAERVGVLEIGLDGRDHDPSFDMDKVDAHERHPAPAVNDHAFVQDAVQNFDEAAAPGTALDVRHGRSLRSPATRRPIRAAGAACGLPRPISRYRFGARRYVAVVFYSDG